MDNLIFDNNGLIPAIIQNRETDKVLMLGYMNREALDTTINSKRVTFFSRSKRRLWVKGETSGNFLNLVEILPDCDNDSLLIKVDPVGVTCHTGSESCFGDKNQSGNFLFQLEKVIRERIEEKSDKSYTYSLYKKGINRVAQKVGEEAIEVVIESKDDNRDKFTNEVADLIYHLLLLLVIKGESLGSVVSKLEERGK